MGRQTWRTNGVLYPYPSEPTRNQLSVDDTHTDDLGDDYYRYQETLVFEADYLILTDGLVWAHRPWGHSLDPLLFLDLVVDRSIGKKLVLSHRNIKSWRNAKEVST